ncbi:MAG: GAF domain-containing protein [Proteobacteria bacterium]|nr:GAF domain-containing protein [Pseudomonadota bacterium]
MSEIVNAARDAFDCHNVMLLLLDEKTKRLTLQSITGEYADVFPNDLWIAVGEGMIGHAATTGEIQISGDVSQNPHHVRKAEEQSKSELAVPIKSGSQVIGVLDVQSDEFNAFAESERVTMEILSTLIATAIKNARLFKESRIHGEEMSVLNELGRDLTASLNVDQILNKTYQQATRLVDTRCFYIAFYHPEKDKVSFPFVVDPIDKKIATRRAGNGLTEYVIRHRASVLISENLAERLEKMGIEAVGTLALSWLGVPLMVGDRVLGIMAVQSYTTPGIYDEHSRDLLTAIASQVAIALQNAQLYEKVERELIERKRAEDALQQAYAEVEQQVKEQTAELRRQVAERERLQQTVIDAQQQTLQEISTPIIPIVETPDGSGSIIIMPLIGGIDSMRARHITRALLAGIQKHQAKVVILDITGVPIVDSGVGTHLSKTIQAARLKGAYTIITGISEAVAEVIVDLGIDWSNIETLSDLQTGLIVALNRLNMRLSSR